MADLDTSRISPTAHYTGYVWCRHRLSPPELATPTGRAMFYAMAAPVAVAALATGGITLEKMLLQRHLIIDAMLEDAIADGRVGQVLEVACGLSGRGHRLATRHPSLVYVEGDLPGMAGRKKRMLGRIPRRAKNHHVVALNALVADGPDSIFDATAPYFDTNVGTAIITEGLLSYFSSDWVQQMWQRFSELLGRYPHGMYLSDIHFGDRATEAPVIHAFRSLLKVVARGDINLHFRDDAALADNLTDTHGFTSVKVHRPSMLVSRLDIPIGRGADYVHVLEARC